MVEALSCIGSNDSNRVLFRTDTDANALVHTAKNPSQHGEAEVFLRYMTSQNQPCQMIKAAEPLQPEGTRRRRGVEARCVFVPPGP